MSIIRFIVLTALGLVLYFAAYAWVKRPITDGEIVRLVAQKTTLLETVPSPRLVILSGSNGRFGHSCAVMAPLVGRPCVNAALIAGIGADYLFATVSPLLHAGDVVYMPFEYEEYRETRASSFSGPDNEIMWHGNRRLLASLGAERVVHAAFYADEAYFIQGAVEMALSAHGVKPRVGAESMNQFGDQIGHTRAVGEPYQAVLRTARANVPVLSLEGKLPYSAQVLSEFLEQAHRRGIRVIGGLPTLVSNQGSPPVPPETVQQLRAFYEARHQDFLVLPNESRYPPDCFFDKPYHLNEECQRVHSQAIGERLRQMMATDTAR